jgi:FkbM family methyltransferase
VAERRRLPGRAPAAGPLRSHSQNGEDLILYRFLPQGFYVDVGAFDGVYLSNTLVLEEGGWDGICVEAIPEYAELARQNRTAKVINAAVVREPQDHVQFEVDPTGLFSGLDPDKPVADTNYRRFRPDQPTWKTIEVPAVTLEQLLDDCPPVDVLSLDIEGAELDALHGLGPHRPRLVVLEANTQEQRAPLDQYLATLGYELARSLKWNHFYTRTQIDARRLRWIHGWVWLERPPHPLRPELTKLGYPGGRLRRI